MPNPPTPAPKGPSFSQINFKSPITWVVIIGGGAALYFVYRRFMAGQGSNTPTGSTSSTTTAATGGPTGDPANTPPMYGYLYQIPTTAPNPSPVPPPGSDNIQPVPPEPIIPPSNGNPGVGTAPPPMPVAPPVPSPAAPPPIAAPPPPPVQAPPNPQTPPQPAPVYVHPTAWPTATSTLSGIASAHGLSLSRLEALNPWIYQQRGTWNLIYTGDRIRIS